MPEPERAQRQGDANGVGWLGGRGWVSRRLNPGQGTGTGMGIRALCHCSLCWVLCSHLLCISISDLWWASPAESPICLSVCFHPSPVPLCPFPASQLLSVLVRTMDQRLGDPHHHSDHPYLSRAHFQGTHLLCPRTLPTGFFLQEPQLCPLQGFFPGSPCP